MMGEIIPLYSHKHIEPLTIARAVGDKEAEQAIHDLPDHPRHVVIRPALAVQEVVGVAIMLLVMVFVGVLLATGGVL